MTVDRPEHVSAPMDELSRTTTTIRRNWIVSILRPALVGLLAALILSATFKTGQMRGMDHAVAYGPHGEQVALTVALSETVYGLKLGYLGHASVLAKLQEIWNRGAKDPFDRILIENSHNSALINEAITAASSMGPLTPGYLSDRTLITTLQDDMGQVDFVSCLSSCLVPRSNPSTICISWF